MKKSLITLLLLIFAASTFAKDLDCTFTSPDGKLKIYICTKYKELQYTVWENELKVRNVYALDNKAFMDFDGVSAGAWGTPSKAKRIHETFKADNYKITSFSDEYNQVIVKNKNGVNVEFRAYNSGVAYRFVTTNMKDKDWKVNGEVAEFNFADDNTAYIPYSTNSKKPKAMAFQATYDVAPLSETKNIDAFLPATIDCNSAKVTIMETDVEGYPGMFVVKGGDASGASRLGGKSMEGLKADFAKYPKAFDYYPWRVQKYVTDTENFIAKGHGNRTFPWRILAITRDDKEMPTNTLAYQLSAKNRIEGDLSWIKPGKVAWDWWNDWSISGVDFKAGINQDTYKYYIDFAAKQGLEYVILDEGWYTPKSGDMLTVIPDLNLQELVEYGKKRNVGIILWTVFNVLDKQLNEACDIYSAMGIKGFKVDFLDRYDQEGVDMIYRIAKRCAESQLLLDYHGIFAPQGITRTYPNVINFEAVFGMEEVKWTERETVNVNGKYINQPSKDMPLYDVTFPYIRGMVGPTDFTPGGMRNATKADFQPINNNPLTMGTRCHQLAHYIVHESPLTMLADNPTAYMKNMECTSFIASLPTVYEDMKCIDGKMGEYIVIARRQGNNWYVGGEANWDGKEVTLDWSFLPEGTFEATIFTDGINADKDATDYLKVTKNITNKAKTQIKMMSGGGFAIKLLKK